MAHGHGYSSRFALSVYVACFSIGAFNHARDFLAWGWRPYAWGPPLLEAFWTSLLAFDVIVVGLILAGRRRPGLLLAAIIMIVDVAANAFAWLALGVPAFAAAVPLQAAFLGFVLGSMPFLWEETASSAHGSGDERSE